MIISASRDTTVRLWNIEMKRNLAIYRLSSPVWQAKFCNRGYYFATASAEQSVMLWCTERVQPLRIFGEVKKFLDFLKSYKNPKKF
jgi:transcription initiation factor TFIID subunit 5